MRPIHWVRGVAVTLAVLTSTPQSLSGEELAPPPELELPTRPTPVRHYRPTFSWATSEMFRELVSEAARRFMAEGKASKVVWSSRTKAPRPKRPDLATRIGQLRALQQYQHPTRLNRSPSASPRTSRQTAPQQRAGAISAVRDTQRRWLASTSMGSWTLAQAGAIDGATAGSLVAGQVVMGPQLAAAGVCGYFSLSREHDAQIWRAVAYFATTYASTPAP